jgi:hypothetical protein
MSDWHNWKISVDLCHQKHIGPPPAQQRRIAYVEAHRWAAPSYSRKPLAVRIATFMRRFASSTIGKLQ